jgi:plastocyanin
VTTGTGMVRSTRWHRLLLGAMAALAACSDSAAPARQTVVPTPVDPKTAGTIHVTVRYQGVAPVRREISMSSAPQCAAAHPEPAVDESLLVNDGRLANAVVWIKSGLEHWVFAPPAQPLSIDQHGCLYHPRIAAAMVGQAVRFINSDKDPHNVHGQPSVVSGWNFLMNPKGPARTVSFDKPEIGIPVGCDIHPWMRAYLSVIANPYFAVTPADGAVTLSQVPPGDYVLGVWHEKLGAQEQRLTLSPSGSATADFVFAGKD